MTDQDGLATFTLRYGKYTYQEYDAPEGYLIDEREFPFEIREDGQVGKPAMTNEKKPVEIITTPKTGDESNVGLLDSLIRFIRGGNRRVRRSGGNEQEKEGGLRLL